MHYFFYLFFLIAVMLVGCGSSGGDSTDSDTDTDTGTDTGTSSAILDTSHFRSIISANTVSCILNNGSTTTCHQLVFADNIIYDGGNSNAPVDDEAGPFCPQTKTSGDGGVGIYDGDTNPGLQKLDETLFDNMLTDGYDLIDESAGNKVCVEDFTDSSNDYITASCGGNNGARCLTASPDDTLTITYLIPETPELLSSASTIGEVENVGVSLDGVPITGSPPSVVDNNGKIPSLDFCGGHHDPSGYYHWHFIPESINTVHADKSTGVNCTEITQASSALTGYAKDGFPIYAYQDEGGVTPTDLDECNGHTGATAEFPSGVYHYHASETEASNLPPCLKGAFVSQGSPDIN